MLPQHLLQRSRHPGPEMRLFTPVPEINSIRVPIRSLSAATWGDGTALAVLTECRQCL